MKDRIFVDTNILVYSVDSGFPEKQQKAHEYLRNLWETRTGRTSIQVLNEFFVTVTRKLASPMTAERAWIIVESYFSWEPVVIDTNLLSGARAVNQNYSLSWWDALIIAAARSAGCTTIATEDMGADQVYSGVAVVDPFRA